MTFIDKYKLYGSLENTTILAFVTNKNIFTQLSIISEELLLFDVPIVFCFVLFLYF